MSNQKKILHKIVRIRVCYLHVYFITFVLAIFVTRKIVIINDGTGPADVFFERVR